MTPTDRYYERWVKGAAKKTPLKEIKRHIIGHAHDIDDSTRNLPVSWIASMYNLLAMYEIKTGAKVMAGHKIYKFAKKYLNNRGKRVRWLMGPPGGKVPQKIVVTYTRAGTWKRSGDKNITVQMVRKIGRG